MFDAEYVINSTRYTLWDIKSMAVNFMQQLLQILTDLDNFSMKLTSNE